MGKDQKEIKNINQTIDELSDAIDQIMGGIKPKYQRLAYEKFTIKELLTIILNDTTLQLLHKKMSYRTF